MTVAVHTERVSTMGRASQPAGVSKRTCARPGCQMRQALRLQSSTSLAIQRLASKQCATGVSGESSPDGRAGHHAVSPQKGACRGGWGAEISVPAGVGAGGAPISTQCGITNPPVDNFGVFKSPASSSNSAQESSGTTRTLGGYDCSSSSRSDGDTPSASASASRQQPAFRHACHPQSSQYATPPAVMAMEPRS